MIKWLHVSLTWQPSIFLPFTLIIVALMIMKQKKWIVNSFGEHKLYQGHVNSTHSVSSCKEESHCFWRWNTSRINCRIRYMLNWQWWLACVLHLSPDESQVKLKLLHPPGPANSFKYPPLEHTITIAIKDVLTIVDPRTRTGRVYTLSQKEVKSASQKLGTMLERH